MIRVDADDPDEVQVLGHGYVLTFSHYGDEADTWWLTVKSTISDIADEAVAEVPVDALAPLAAWLADRDRRHRHPLREVPAS